jgi:Fur family peroxide stress response transcriptional regulator
MMEYRRSKQREAIHRFLRANDSHPTAQHIYEELRKEFPSLSLGTVYRNLNILEEQGKVRKLQYGSTFDRFDADTDEHYHFICRRCGRVYDLELEPQDHLERRAAEIGGHRVDDHAIDFYGTCRLCRE